MAKRIYYETTETVVKQQKGWIEIDTDFTQIYNCFKEISKNIHSPTSWKLLFWLLSEEANKSNGFRTDTNVYNKFVLYLGKEAKVSRTTFQNSIDELVKCQAITKVGKGFYYFSPYIFWKDDKEKRLEFIKDEVKDQNYISYNPINDELK
jgi:hypothetical protein